MHIMRFTASIDQAYLSRYKDLQQIKAAKKGLLNSCSREIISSISRLQDMSSEVVESNIQRNSRDMYSSNITAISDSSPFSRSCNKSSENNPTNPQKGSNVFMGDNNTQNMMNSNDLLQLLLKGDESDIAVIFDEYITL